MSKTLAVEMNVNQLRKQAEEKRAQPSPKPSAGEFAPSPSTSALLEQTNARLEHLVASLEQVRADLHRWQWAAATTSAQTASALPRQTRSARVIRTISLVLCGTTASAAYVEWRHFAAAAQAKRAVRDATAPSSSTMPAPQALVPLQPQTIPESLGLGLTDILRRVPVEFGEIALPGAEQSPASHATPSQSPPSPSQWPMRLEWS